MKNTVWIPEPFEKVTWGTDLVTVLSCNLDGICSISLNGERIQNIGVEQLSPLYYTNKMNHGDQYARLQNFGW